MTDPTAAEPRWFFQPCPNDCGCVLPDDADRRDCGCDGRCTTEAWPIVLELDDNVREGAVPIFDAAAVAAERKACAGAVDEMCDDVDDPFMYGTLRAVAAAIRSRGEAT